MALYVPDTGVAPLDLFEDLARTVVQQYTDAENEVLRQLQRRIDRMLPENDAFTRLEAQAAQLRELRTDAQKVLANIDENLAMDVAAQATREGSAAALARIGLIKHLPTAGPLTSTSASATVQVALDLKSRLDDVKQRILRYEQDAYQRVIAGHLPGVLLGTTSSLDAQKQAVADWLSQGIPGFVDKAGRNWSVGGYVEMATRTGLSRAYLEASLYRQQQVGLNLVTIVVGASACASCAQWIGRILSLDGSSGTVSLPNAVTGDATQVDVFGSLSSARGGHLFGPNCRCQAVAYSPGLSIPHGATTYDPVKEKASNDQRAFERRLRSDKRKLELSPSESQQAALRARIRGTEANLRKHLDEHPELTRQRNREQTSFQYGKPAAPPPAPREPSPAPTPTAPPASSPAAAPLAEQIAGMSAAEAASYATARHGIPFVGWDGLPADSARTAISSVSNLLDQFPKARLERVEGRIPFGDDPPGALTMAYVTTPRVSKQLPTKNGGVKTRKVNLTPRMTFNPAFFTEKHLTNAVETSNRSGHFHDVATDPDGAMQYVATHEFMHVLDSNVGDKLANLWQREASAQSKASGLPYQQWKRDNLSGYATRNKYEGIAEALADAIVHGDQAFPFSKHLLPLALDILKAEL